MTKIEESILKLDAKLQGVPFDFAFLGGSVLSLLVTDPVADTIRVTKDVDVMMNIRTRSEYHRADRLLESLGFKHDTREDAPICRWVYEDVTVDVLPIREEVLGWNSKWFKEALDEATTVDCGDRTLRIVSAPYFVALKLEAFEDRGKCDFLPARTLKTSFVSLMVERPLSRRLHHPKRFGRALPRNSRSTSPITTLKMPLKVLSRPRMILKPAKTQS